MIYLDTGCLVKLYYPEPDSARVAGLIQERPICFTPLHELEFVNALHLKLHFGSAAPEQIASARHMVRCDLLSGVLVSAGQDWPGVFAEAVKASETYTVAFGCRSLDILHCAAAKILAVTEFISTDARQLKLAAAIGLKLAT